LCTNDANVPIAISCGKKIAKFITTGYLITSKIALVMRIQV